MPHPLSPPTKLTLLGEHPYCLPIQSLYVIHYHSNAYRKQGGH